MPQVTDFMHIPTKTVGRGNEEARSGIRNENIQEHMDAAKNWRIGQQQYYTPFEIVKEALPLMLSLSDRCTSVLDPQCGEGDLIGHCSHFDTMFHRYGGIDIDGNAIRAAKLKCSKRYSRGNCVTVMQNIAEECPDYWFGFVIANPPFGLNWNLQDGKTIDSVEWTWNLIKERTRFGGLLVYKADSIEDKGWNKDPDVVYYKRFSSAWKGVLLDIGVLVFKSPSASTVKYGFMSDTHPWKAFLQECRHLDSEELEGDRCNVEMKGKLLSVYLSTRYEGKIEYSKIVALRSLDRKDPAVLAIDRVGRNSLTELIESGIYTISSEAHNTIETALSSYTESRTPIVETSDYQDLAYVDIQDELECIRDGDDVELSSYFKAGLKYSVSTRTEKITRWYKKKVLRYIEGKLHSVLHDFKSVGCARITRVGITSFCETTPYDSDGNKDFSKGINFANYEDENSRYEKYKDEKLIWKYFKRPVVKTVKELYSDVYNDNVRRLGELSYKSGFSYFEGQEDYIARIATKPYGCVAAEVGCGKSLMALSIAYLRNSKRTLLVAPQATVINRDPDTDGKSIAQWSDEIKKFAPHLTVYEIYTKEDFYKLCKDNDCSIPEGIYLSYWEAMFLNQSWTLDDKSKKDKDLGDILGVEVEYGESNFYASTIGKEVYDIRCVAIPTLADVMNGHFDTIIMDEAHKVKNKDAKTTSNMLRLQAANRYLLTATPIPNSIKDMFTLLGWVSVPGWFSGCKSNPTWPFLLHQGKDFEQLFLTREYDETECKIRKSRGEPAPAGKSIPVLSNAPTLLKLIGPIIAYTSKARCSRAYKPGEVRLLKVPMESSQHNGYIKAVTGVYSDHIESIWRRKGHIQMCTREVCADPIGFSEMAEGFSSDGITPKLVAAIGLIRNIVVQGGEQCVILSARVKYSSLIAEWLRKMAIPFSRVDSSLPPSKHPGQVKKFKDGKTRVLLMGNKCAQAYSFDKCAHQIIVSMEFSYGHLAQGIGRIDRINSVKPPTTHIIVHSDSFEETIVERVCMKKDIATLALHGEMTATDFIPMDTENYFAEVYDSLNTRSVTVSRDECMQDLKTIIEDCITE